MNTKTFFRTILYLLWGLILTWGVLYANNTIYQVLSAQPRNSYVNDILSANFSLAHLNNLGHYPTGFILFQVGFSTILGLAFGYSRVKTASIYPAILLHALFNLAGTF